MTPIYFKQKGAQIVLKSDSIKVIVCRRIRNIVGESILTYPGRQLIRSNWFRSNGHSVSEVLLSNGKYYFLHTVYSSLPNNIDDFINDTVEEATDAMQWI
jgi:hypothetical protein